MSEWTETERKIAFYEMRVLEAKENVAICKRQGWDDLLEAAEKELDYFVTQLRRLR